MDTIITVKGLRPVERSLAKLARRFGDLLLLMDRIGVLLASNTRHRFETETAPDGQQWKASRRAEEQGGKTLTLDGHLRDSITHLAGPSQVEVGSNLVYARIHQLGGTIVPKSAPSLAFKLPDGVLVHAKSVVIPARPFLGIDDADLRGIDRQVRRFTEEALA